MPHDRSHHHRPAVIAFAIACGFSCGAAPTTPTTAPTPVPWIDDTSLWIATEPSPSDTTLRDYGPAADRIREFASTDRGAYEKLRVLSDEIGARLSGSAELERAVAWAAETMRADGHEVTTEPVMVPHWVRGNEHAELTAPRKQRLAVLGLGGSVATPATGIEAPVVVIHSWDELEAKKQEVKGAIVLYNVALPVFTRGGGTGYDRVVGYRWRGASAAAKLGAAAMLMRSVTARSLASPHTGSLGYEDNAPRIPAAAISVEDAELLARLTEAGKRPRVRLNLESKHLPDAPSANVVGELRGRERPDEIVVIGAHLDSWDVGTGAHDDGAGCVVMMQALTTLRKLGLTPRRTIRVVLFTNEENGLRGGKGYAERHAAEIDKHVLAIESDTGGFRAMGFFLEASPDRTPSLLRELVPVGKLLAPISADNIESGYSGADIQPLAKASVPALGLAVDMSTYFDLHHSHADTFDKIAIDDLRSQVIAVATMAYAIADQPKRLGR